MSSPNKDPHGEPPDTNMSSPHRDIHGEKRKRASPDTVSKRRQRFGEVTLLREHAQAGYGGLSSDPAATSTRLQLGKLHTCVHVRDMPLMAGESEQLSIQNCEFVGSYNLTDKSEPTIITPGQPPRWTPLPEPRQLEEDSGDYFRDTSAALYPDYPMEPAARVYLKNKQASPTHGPDIFVCGFIMRKLLDVASGVWPDHFRFLVEAVGGTVFFNRREDCPEAVYPVRRGYGHTFPEAYTTWEPAVRGSVSHQRLVEYTFAGLRFVVRSGADGYLPDLLPDEDFEHKLEEVDAGTSDEGATFTEIPTSASTLQINGGGSRIPQSAVFELATRPARKKSEGAELARRMGRLWLARIPNFILAKYKDGVFQPEDIRWINLVDDFAQWEDKNHFRLRQFKFLLDSIVDFGRKNRRFEVVGDVRSQIKFHGVEGDVHVLSNDVAELWRDRYGGEDLDLDTSDVDAEVEENEPKKCDGGDNTSDGKSESDDDEPDVHGMENISSGYGSHCVF